ncbi:MAG: DNA topoisomerase I [archaeon]
MSFFSGFSGGKNTSFSSGLSITTGYTENRGNFPSQRINSRFPSSWHGRALLPDNCRKAERCRKNRPGSCGWGRQHTKARKGLGLRAFPQREKIVVVSAVGHLYGLAEKDKGRWTYLVLETKWVPVWESNKGAGFARPYLSAIQNFSEGASEVYNATDYDVEGAVIGYNILKFACGRSDARRMKFSTLTARELQFAFESAAEHLDFPQIEAGLARHELDWLYGINLSRALTLAIKKAGRWQVLSTGRVQGPALALLARREREIAAFKPTPYWQIELLTEKSRQGISALHVADKLWDRKTADEIIRKTSGAESCTVSNIEKKTYSQAPPTPFDLTKLQTEAYRHFGFAPARTQSIAQALYEKALISYPRTSSQKLPARLNLREILVSLSRQKKYSEPAGMLAAKEGLRPNEGNKEDPAHPAIHPTGERPKSLTEEQGKLYDLIVLRFLAVFGEPAERETVTATFDVNGELFSAAGHTTTKAGWIELYGPYAKFEENTLPALKKGEPLPVNSINLLSKETEPPPRYNEASLIRELEKENLGTKATRADIIRTLYSRGYVAEKKIVVTELGMAVVESLEKNAPKIISPELTRELEGEMENIVAGKTKRESVIDRAKKVLVETLEGFREKEKEVGEILLKGLQVTQKVKETLGACPSCGGTLKIVFNPKTRKKFVGCSGYPTCKNAYPLPSGLIETTEKVCEFCRAPAIKVIRAGKRPFVMCLTVECESKKDWGKKNPPGTGNEKRSAAAILTSVPNKERIQLVDEEGEKDTSSADEGIGEEK